MPVDNVSGYAVFEGGLVKRVVFVNLVAWLSSAEASGAVRPSVHLDLGFVFSNATSSSSSSSSSSPSSPSSSSSASSPEKTEENTFAHATMTIRRLVVDHADDLGNLTWAGQSYEESADASPTGQEVVEVVPVHQGVDLRASEAVLVSFDV